MRKATYRDLLHACYTHGFAVESELFEHLTKHSIVASENAVRAALRKLDKWSFDSAEDGSIDYTKQSGLIRLIKGERALDRAIEACKTKGIDVDAPIPENDEDDPSKD